jgi:hypothetical protein
MTVGTGRICEYGDGEAEFPADKCSVGARLPTEFIH